MRLQQQHIDMTREFLSQYDRMVRAYTSPEVWIAIRLGCHVAKARALVAAVRGGSSTMNYTDSDTNSNTVDINTDSGTASNTDSNPGIAGLTHSGARRSVRGWISYRLSTDGQRAALAAGLSAQAEQRTEGDIPIDLLSICTISDAGIVTCDLSQTWPYAPPGGTMPNHRKHNHNAPLVDPIAAYREQYRLVEAEIAEEAARAQRSEEARIAKIRDEEAKAAAAARAREDAISAWIAKYGSVSQRQRLAVGRLPEWEVLDAMTRHAFAAVTAKDYSPVTRAMCLAALDLDDDEAPEGDPTDKTDVVWELTEAQWEALESVRVQLPADTHLQVLRIQSGLYTNTRDTDVVQYAIEASMPMPPSFLFTRRFACPDA